MEAYANGDLKSAQSLVGEFEGLGRPFDKVPRESPCSQEEEYQILKTLLACNPGSDTDTRSWTSESSAKQDILAHLKNQTGAQLSSFAVSCGLHDHARYEFLCWEDDALLQFPAANKVQALSRLQQKINSEIIDTLTWEAAPGYGSWQSLWALKSKKFSAWEVGPDWKASETILSIGKTIDGKIYISGLALLK